MTKRERHRAELREAGDRDGYLRANSGLPGPRANLELIQAAADEGSAAEIRRWAAREDDEFLASCGAVGLGRLAADGDASARRELRALAGDGRWRVREGVAMGLQRLGAADFNGLAGEMEIWADGTALERRAAAAALCEPVLLSSEDRVRRVLEILDRITGAMAAEGERGEDFRVLRQGMGYCWSVAVAAAPAPGKAAFERLLETDDPDVRWVLRENLRKKRLERMDAAWVAEMRRRVEDAG